MPTKVKYGPITLLNNGFDALKQIPGLRGALVKGFFINLAIYFALALTLNLLFFFFAHQPLENLLIEHTPAWLSIFGRVLLWILQIAIGLVFMLFSIRVSLMLMEIWYEALAARVVHFRRGKPQAPTLRMRLIGFALLVPMILKEIGIAVMLLMISFIPVIGPITVFACGCFLMGKMITDPYQDTLKNMGAERDLVSEGKVTPFPLGLVPMSLALIPILGWLCLPFYMVLQVTGLAWAEERD